MAVINRRDLSTFESFRAHLSTFESLLRSISSHLAPPAQPLYNDDRDDDADVGTYDSASQIHAGWILWRAGSLIAEPKMILDAYRRDLGELILAN